MTSQLIFNTRDELVRVDLEKVVFFESDGNYIQVVFINGFRQQILTSLVNIEKLLDNKNVKSRSVFARIGKKYIINCSFIAGINILKQNLILSDLVSPNVYTLSISKEALKKLKELYGKKQ